MTTEERRRIAELEKENRELRRANEILRSASTFFTAAGTGGWSSANPTPKPTVAPTPKPTPKPTPSRVVTFTCNGTDDGYGIDISYGDTGSSLGGPSSLDGTWTTTLPYDGSTEYYDIDAQLQGAGQVTWTVTVQGDGHRIGQRRVQPGHPRGREPHLRMAIDVVGSGPRFQGG